MCLCGIVDSQGAVELYCEGPTLIQWWIHQ